MPVYDLYILLRKGGGLLMPGKKMHSIKGGEKGKHQYEGLREHGMPKESAAKITNAAAKKRKKGK